MGEIETACLEHTHHLDAAGRLAMEWDAGGVEHRAQQAAQRDVLDV